MFTRIMLTSLIAATVATSAVEAAPLKLDVSEFKAYDRWVEIFRPGDLVGPEIDPDNPLHKADVVEFDPQPDPPKVDVEIVVVQR
jgi:hypothetical protein